MKVLKRCPLCRKPAHEWSGGWATEYVCGTRRGNMSGEIIWKGENCSKTKGLDLPNKRTAILKHWLGDDYEESKCTMDGKKA